MRIAGINTITALIQSTQGDMSKLTSTLVPSFSEVYDNLNILNQEKQDLLSAGDGINITSNTIKVDFEYVSASDVENWFN